MTVNHIRRCHRPRHHDMLGRFPIAMATHFPPAWIMMVLSLAVEQRWVRTPPIAGIVKPSDTRKLMENVNPKNPTSCECSEINSSAMWQGIIPLSDLSTTVELNSHNITCLSCLHYPPTFNFGWKKHSKRTWACSSTTTLGNNNPPLVITTFKESRGKTVHVKAMKFRPST